MLPPQYPSQSTNGWNGPPFARRDPNSRQSLPSLPIPSAQKYTPRPFSDSCLQSGQFSPFYSQNRNWSNYTNAWDAALAPLLDNETGPDLTPLLTPDRTPLLTPDRTPLLTPDRTPLLTPDLTQLLTPDRTQLLTPDRTQLLTPDRTPLLTPDRTPLLTPDRTPLLTPDKTPLLTPDRTSGFGNVPLPRPNSKPRLGPPTTTLLGQNDPQILPQNVSFEMQHGTPHIPKKVPHSQHSIPRPHFSTCKSRSELAQQLMPLSCIFKENWIQICENAPATEKLNTVRQCLDPKKVPQKKPQEMNSIMKSAKLTDEECGWLLDVRRKMMRQRNRQTKRKTPAKSQTENYR